MSTRPGAEAVAAGRRGLAWGFKGLVDRDVFEMIAGRNHLVEIAIDLPIGLSALVVGDDMIAGRA